MDDHDGSDSMIEPPSMLHRGLSVLLHFVRRGEAHGLYVLSLDSALSRL